MVKPNLRDMSLAEIEEFILRLGKEKYRAKQIMKWLYRTQATTFAQMTTLARDFRDKISGIAAIDLPEIIKIKTSQDGTDRKSTRLNSSHQKISYAVFCLKKKN